MQESTWIGSHCSEMGKSWVSIRIISVVGLKHIKYVYICEFIMIQKSLATLKDDKEEFNILKTGKWMETIKHWSSFSCIIPTPWEKK
jgi:hypothetical protein